MANLIRVGAVGTVMVALIWVLSVTYSPEQSVRPSGAMLNQPPPNPTPTLIRVGMLEDDAVHLLQERLREELGTQVAIDEYEARRMTLGEYKLLMDDVGVPTTRYPTIGDPVVDVESPYWIIVFRTRYPLHASGFVFAPEEALEYYANDGGATFVDSNGRVTALVALHDYNMTMTERSILTNDLGTAA